MAASLNLPVLRRSESLAERATQWAELLPEERRRRAVQAIAVKDVEGLWRLVEGHLTLHGEAGARVSPLTLRSYHTGLRIFLEWAEGRALSLTRPSRDAGAAYARVLEGRGLAPSTVRVRLAAAKALYAALRWSDVTDARPFAEVRPAPDRTPRHQKRRPYAPEDVEALLAAAGPHDRALVLLGAHAGLRVAEAVNLAWRDVDVDGLRLRVRHGKGGKDGTVVLSRRLGEALAALDRQGEFVMPFRSPDQARERLMKLARRTGVAYLGFHALRHAAGTRLLRTKGDLRAVQEHLRHADISTTAVYAHYASDDLRETLADW